MAAPITDLPDGPEDQDETWDDDDTPAVDTSARPGPIDPDLTRIVWTKDQVGPSFKIATPKQIEPRHLEHGWLFKGLLQLDLVIHQRWTYWMYVSLNEWALPPEGIPYLHFAMTSAPCQARVRKMLETCLDSIAPGWMGWSSWSHFEYFLKWQLFAFGDNSQPELPPEPHPGASMNLFQIFNLGPVLLYPADYYGALFSEAAVGRGVGFYPTPMAVATMMADITCADTGSKRDMRLMRANEPCIGTGALALAMSNHVLSICGQDVNPLCVLATKVQGYYYAPWMVRPIKWLEDAIRQKEKWDTIWHLLTPDTAHPGTTAQLQPLPRLEPDDGMLELIEDSDVPDLPAGVTLAELGRKQQREVAKGQGQLL